MANFTTRTGFGNSRTLIDSEFVQTDTSLQSLLIKLLVFAFIAAAAVSAIYIFWGGISFILSGGNDEKIKKAVNTIRYAIIGLIVTIISGVFVTFIGKFFGLDLEQFIPSISEIKGYINEFASNLNFSNTNSSNTRPY